MSFFVFLYNKEVPIGVAIHTMDGNEVILSENDLKNLGKVEQPVGGDGDRGGGGAYATMHVRTLSDFKSIILQLAYEEKSPSSLKPQCLEVPRRLHEGGEDYYEPKVMSDKNT